MNRTRSAAVGSVVFALFAFPALVHAQATRTWVSGLGDDANPCSRTAPCKTFAGAIAKTAPAGDIDVLDPGGFGAVTITKSITLDGTSGLAGVLVAGTNGIIVSASASDVVIIRNLDFNGLGTGLSGILILGAGDVRIENCKIYAFNRGIEDNRSSGHLAVLNTVVSNNSQTGILALPGGASILAINLDRVQMHSNGNAGFAITSGAQAMIVRSTASSNVHGFYADSNAVINLDDSFAFANFATGLNAQTGATIRIFNTTVTDNTTGLSTTGGSILSYGLNRIDGNAAGNGPPTSMLAVQ